MFNNNNNNNNNIEFKILPVEMNFFPAAGHAERHDETSGYFP